MAIILQGVFKGAAAGTFLLLGSTTQPGETTAASPASAAVAHNNQDLSEPKKIAPALPDKETPESISFPDRLKDAVQTFRHDFTGRVGAGRQTNFNACFTRTTAAVDPARVNMIRTSFTRDNNQNYTQSPIVVLDRGHGSDNDMGASRHGIREAAVVDAVADKLKPSLESRGMSIVETRGAVAQGQKLGREYRFRDQDRALQWRAELSYKLSVSFPDRPVIFISLHANTSEIEGRHGGEVYYYRGGGPASAESRNLARHIADHYRLTRSTSVLSENFAVLRCQNSQTPAVLLELGYLTNKEDFELLSSMTRRGEKAEKIATMIARGIDAYVDSRKPSEPVITIAMNGP